MRVSRTRQKSESEQPFFCDHQTSKSCSIYGNAPIDRQTQIYWFEVCMKSSSSDVPADRLEETTILRAVIRAPIQLTSGGGGATTTRRHLQNGDSKAYRDTEVTTSPEVFPASCFAAFGFVRRKFAFVGWQGCLVFAKFVPASSD